MKRVARTLRAAVFLSAVALPATAADQLCGDLNNNGSISAGDSLTLLRFAVGQAVEISCPAGLHCWDNDADNVCDASEDVNVDQGCDVLDCKGTAETGIHVVTVGPVEWQADTPTEFPRTVLSYNRAEFTSQSESGSAFLHLNPALPGEIAGKPMRLRGTEICWDASATNVNIEAVYITVTRGTLSAVGASEVIGEIADESIHHDRICKRYDIDPGFNLSGGGLVSVRVQVVWQATGMKFRIAGTTFELEPIP